MNKDALPRWIDIGLLPLINLAAALVVSGIIIAYIPGNYIQCVVFWYGITGEANRFYT